MIKIIKEGTKKKCTCDECGCLFSYDIEDICHRENYRNEDCYVNGAKEGHKKLIICPQCKCEIVLEATR